MIYAVVTLNDAFGWLVGIHLAMMTNVKNCKMNGESTGLFLNLGLTGESHVCVKDSM